MARLLIRNIDWLLTLDGERRIVRDASVQAADGRLVYVGPAREAPAGFTPDEIIEGHGLLGLPGLVDATVSNVQHLGRGAGDGCDMPRYRLERSLALEAALSAEDARAAARACQLEMLRAGTTTFADAGSHFPDEVAAAARDTGMRALVSRACYDVEETFVGTLPKGLAELPDSSLRKIPAHAALALPWLTACSDALLAAAGRAAKERGLRVIVSVGMARDDAVASRREHHRTEVARLAAAGLLSARTIVSHAGWISPLDMRTLADSGASVVSCPAASHRLGTGALEFGRYPELMAFGVNVALGSGGAMAASHVDLVRQLFAFGGSHMSLRLDATVAPPESMLEMATRNGARALGVERETGSLDAGKSADLAFFRTAAPDWVPVHNPLGNLAYSARGGADTVVAGGRVLMQAGNVRSVDELDVLAEAQRRADALVDRANLRRHCQPAWPVE